MSMGGEMVPSNPQSQLLRFFNEQGERGQSHDQTTENLEANSVSLSNLKMDEVNNAWTKIIIQLSKMEYFKVFPQKLSWKVCSNQMAAIFMDLKKIGVYRLEISH